MNKKITRRKSKAFWLTLFVAVFSLTALVPFYIMIMMSTHSSTEIFTTINLLPGHELAKNLQTILNGGFVRYYYNSLKIAALTVLISVTISTLTGFAFAKYNFRFKKTLFTFIVVNMMVPPQLGMVAFVMQMKYMNLIDSHLPLIMVYAASTYGVFFMTQYLQGSLPTEVLESARMEGCSEWRLFWRIVVPYAKPCMITLAIIVFMWSWNSYLLPLLILNDKSLYTVPLGIATLGNYYRTDYAAQICGLMVGTLPLITIFAVGSKYFVKGLTAGAVKG